MAEAQPQTHESASLNLSDLDATSSRAPSPHGEKPTSADVEAEGGHVSGDAQQTQGTPEEPDAAPAPVEQSHQALPSNPGAPKSKQATMVKPTPGKFSGPPTPTVKKVINSGTFGTGSAKSTTPKPTTASTLSKPSSSAAPALKKSVSASSAMSSKPTATSVKQPAPARRASVVPPKTTAASSTMAKPPLSSPPSVRPSTSTSRPSVVSPTGSNASLRSAASSARPRAAISDGVKKATPTPRHSLGPGAKPLLSTSASAPRSARAGTSISSIREVEPDVTALQALQVKLEETESNLASKIEAVTQLEEKVAVLQASLTDAQTEAEIQRAIVVEFEQSKADAETRLKELKDVLDALKADHAEGGNALTSIRDELDAARTSSASQTELIESLHSQIQALEAEVVSGKERLDAARESNEAAMSDAAAAAAVEHEAMLRSQADLATFEEQSKALTVAHTKALADADTRIKCFEAKASMVDALEQELAELKAEKEETANRISELEVEVLELKESVETSEDSYSQSLTRIKMLEEDAAKAAATSKKALDDALAEIQEHIRTGEDAQEAHLVELKEALDTRAKAMERITVLQAELTAAQESLQQARIDAISAAEGHASMLAEAEATHSVKQVELSTEIARIAAELEGQEAKYDAKVAAVKAEHDNLLQDAFKRAKAEAEDAHRQDLQALRIESKAALEQLRAQHQRAIDELSTDHATMLEDRVRSLEKQRSNQALELKATQDDLTKAKTGLEAARMEVEKLTSQHDEAVSALATASGHSPIQADEIARLSKELSVTKDDLSAMTEMLNLTKASLAEVSNNHVRELEEAARARADEVTKLRAAHDDEVNHLVIQKSELSIKLSDLEGELVTLKAAAGAEPPVPKANGNGPAHPLSTGVSKEELQRLHEAHNLKMHDLQAQYDKAIQELRYELEEAQEKANQLQTELGRKAMEVEYLEKDQEDSEDQITRLKAEVETLNEELKNKEHPTA